MEGSRCATKAAPPMFVPSMNFGRSLRYSTTLNGHIAASRLAVHRPSMSRIDRPASSTAAFAASASSSISV